ncbi:TRAP transporter large permease subunit [Paenalcaligenes suwonensis]|uniref:TRAP transporter large permease subunit n=1 Tax=Paenalcaligenes suwonensis TaxID=1202713 RepID=UPI00140C1A2F|nr:TRAP transporter large permease subunit [Paenalcaligenes suwonensis]NHC61146.1 TRAP transporter large permease subunit [Paenalcaligenes suwonensis]
MVITIFLSSLLASMAIGIPIAYALLLSGIALMAHLDLFDAQIIAQNLINGANSFALMAVPFFLLAGEIMNTGGLSRRIVNIAMALLGHIKGGLGYVAILAGCLIAALSGSAVADAAALSALLLPMMVKAGYDKSTSAGLIAASGCIAPIIPPSIGFIVFGVAGGLSITKLFLAGIVPGILIGLGLAFAWWLKIRNSSMIMPPKRSRAELRSALADGIWAMMLPVIIIVGLRFGVFTPTEAAVVAVVYSLFVSICVYKEMSLHDLYEVLNSTIKTSAIVMFLIASALVSAWMITIADIPGSLISLLEPFMDHPLLLTAVIIGLVIVVGTSMDMIPVILILTPVLLPVVKEAGVDPIYFGVLFIVACSISLITPPVGSVLTVVRGVAKIGMDDMLKGVFPFILAQLTILLLMIIFPWLVTVPAQWFTG